jgi:serine/threonine-protein kinase
MIGHTVSHYRILEELGGGGMGVVYKAEDTRLERTVALKFLPQELTRDESARERFVLEARAASALDHPTICNVHEIDQTPDGQSFICMAYYEGETLKKKVARGPLPVAEAIETAALIADGLAEAHRHGIVHRDIKPANIMATNEGEVKIVDFGLVKLLGTTGVTRTGQTAGTPVYMSPEQIQGEDVDGRADIFSLGIVLYEMLTGSPPFKGDFDAAVQYGILRTSPEPVSKSRAGVSAGLQAIVDKALQKDPDKRYQNAADMRDDLRAVTAAKLKRPVRRTLLGVALPVAVVLAVLLAVLLEPTARQMAERLLSIDRVPSEKHIAVLPLENIGGDPANQAFCDGLMETLTSRLTQMEQFHGSLWVVPASEVRERNITSASLAGREFGVNLVFTGSVQRLHDVFRLTLNLIEVNTDAPRQLNSTVFDEALADIAGLQDEVVVRVASMLKVELQPKAQDVLFAGGTAVAASYDFYVQAFGYLQQYESVENLDHAVTLFKQAIEQDSLFALAYSGLGEAYWRKFEATKDKQWTERGIESCRRAYELNDMLAPVRVTLGIIRRGTGEYEKAVTEFKQALALDPTNADAYRGLAGVYSDLQKFDEAESTYKKAIDVKPEYWAGYDDLGLFYYDRGRYDDALAQYRRAVALTPGNPRVYNRMGAVHYAQEQWDEARRTFMRSIEIEPTYRVYSNLGVIEYMEGRYAESAAMVEKALALNDKSYVTWLNLANAYYWMPDKRDEAYDIYRRVTRMAEEQRRLNPRNADLLADLAGYHAILGERARALALLDQALAIAPDHWWVLYNHAHAYEQLGDREKALEWLERALEAGYPRKEMERDPFLADLRADKRYERFAER